MKRKEQNLFAFVGDAYLRERAAKKLIAQLQQRHQRAVISVEGRELTGTHLLEHVSGASLFDEAKIVYVRRADEIPEPERVAERIAPSESLVLIFDAEKLDKRSKLYKTLSTHGHIEEFPKPDRRSLPKLVRELLDEHKVRLTPAAITYLLDAVEPEPARLAREIEKLACYLTPYPPSLKGRGHAPPPLGEGLGERSSALDVPEVRELLFSDQSENVLRFLDMVGERNPQSVKYLRQLLQSGEDPNKIFFMLASHVRGLLAVHSLAAQKRSSEEIAAELGRFVWLVGKQRRMAQKFSETELIALIHRLHEEDVNIKTGERSPEESLFDIVLAIVSIP